MLVVGIARVTRDNEGTSRAATGLTHEFAFVVKSGVTVGTQTKLEFCALRVALFLSEVHKGNTSMHLRLLDGVVDVVVVVVVVDTDDDDDAGINNRCPKI